MWDINIIIKNIGIEEISGYMFVEEISKPLLRTMEFWLQWQNGGKNQPIVQSANVAFGTCLFTSYSRDILFINTAVQALPQSIKAHMNSSVFVSVFYSNIDIIGPLRLVSPSEQFYFVPCIVSLIS